VDSRTDVFSLGLLLYEMSTGSQAFAGPSAAVVFEAILNRKPAPVVRWNPYVPADLERSIDRALEKERRFRYQHASDLRSDLERLRRDLSSGHHVVEARVIQPERPPEPVVNYETKRDSKRSGLRKAFLLGLIPGVGALYHGDYKKAAIHVAIFVVLSIIMDALDSRGPFGSPLENAVSWVRIVFVFYMAFDAYHTAQKKK
jgi:serine/threonine protein kinase